MPTPRYQTIHQAYENYTPTEPDDPDSAAKWDGTWTVFDTILIGKWLEVRAVRHASRDTDPTLPGAHVWFVELRVKKEERLRSGVRRHMNAGGRMTEDIYNRAQAIQIAEQLQPLVDQQPFVKAEEVLDFVSANYVHMRGHGPSRGEEK